MKTITRLCCSLAFAIPVFARPAWLDLDFSDTASIGAQMESSLPGAQPSGDVGFAVGQPGIADFGAGGYLKVDSFVRPKGLYTIEARFRLRDYGIKSGHFLSQIAGAVLQQKGVVLRVGGGGLYPILSESDHEHPAIWSYTQEKNYRDREVLSACVGSVSASTTNGQSMEVYTRNCLQLNAWNHLVAIWDGAGFRLYLNGEEATDTSRMVGKGLIPATVDAAPLFIGARSADTIDTRHFNGQLDFIRVFDVALKGEEILKRFQALAAMPAQEFDCHGTLTPNPTTAHGACGAAFSKIVMGSYDSMEVQFAKDPAFKDRFLTYRIEEKDFVFLNHKEKGGLDPAARTYWRTRIIKGGPGPSARIVAWKGTGTLRVPIIPGSLTPGLFRLDGTRVAARTVSETGYWLLDPVHAEAGIFLVRYGRVGSILRMSGERTSTH